MRRTQLYLEEDLWQRLHIVAQETGNTLSALVRRAVRDRYLEGAGNRGDALRAAIGLWRDRGDTSDAAAYVRKLRQGKRLQRLSR